jgi:hypothetical protein
VARNSLKQYRERELLKICIAIENITRAVELERRRGIQTDSGLGIVIDKAFNAVDQLKPTDEVEAILEETNTVVAEFTLAAGV